MNTDISHCFIRLKVITVKSTTNILEHATHSVDTHYMSLNVTNNKKDGLNQNDISFNTNLNDRHVSNDFDCKR